MIEYIRKGIYPIEFVLETFITDFKQKLDFEDVKVKSNSDRYLTFKEKGIECVTCGLKGRFFALEKSKYIEEEIYHFNLYAIDKSNNEVLMTKDYIVPISKGGKNHIDNYQTMCTNCNYEKGNKINN